MHPGSECGIASSLSISGLEEDDNDRSNSDHGGIVLLDEWAAYIKQCEADAGTLETDAPAHHEPARRAVHPAAAHRPEDKLPRGYEGSTVRGFAAAHV